MRIITALKARLDETGATAVEYGLIVGLISAAIVGAVGILGSSIAADFQNVANAVTGGL